MPSSTEKDMPSGGMIAQSEQDPKETARSPPTENGHSAVNGRTMKDDLQGSPTIDSKPLTPEYHPNGNGHGTTQESTAEASDLENAGYPHNWNDHDDTQEHTFQKHEHHDSASSAKEVGILYETLRSFRPRVIADFERVDTVLLDSMTIGSFRDYITHQRLIHLPPRGSTWDKVLRWAEFYAQQVSEYAQTVESFVPVSMDAARLIWTLCRNLLELGPSNGTALKQTFREFYDLGLSLSFLLHHERKLKANRQLREDAEKAFNDLLALVYEVSTYYNRMVDRMTSGSTLELDFYATFGKTVDTFHERKKALVEAMWTSELGPNARSQVRTLRKWLAQTTDPILEVSTTNATQFRSSHDEFTCEWFQPHLHDFSESTHNVFSVTAPAGSGKSVLAGWTRERLQRPLKEHSFYTLCHSIDAEITSEANSATIVKSLLLQLLDISVGNKKLVDGLEVAYQASSKNAKTAEESLWNAFGLGLRSLDSELKSSIPKTRALARIPEALSNGRKNTSHRINKLMILVDGVDALEERGRNQVLEKLSKLSSDHGCLQTIVFLNSVPALAKTDKWCELEIRPQHTQDDVRHVIVHSLRHMGQFQKLSQQDRDTLVQELLQKANGSFLWAKLVIERMRSETSLEAFKKFNQSAEAGLDAFLNQMLGKTDFSNQETKLIISWILVAVRPFTITELEDLLQVNLKRGTASASAPDIPEIIRKRFGLLVIVRNSFVRVRHPAITAALRRLQEKGESIPTHSEAQDDILKRLLIYSKFCLSTHYEPVFEVLPHTQLVELFQTHGLLSYAVRYWTTHSRLTSKFKNEESLDFLNDFKQFFPASPQFALLEWTCWGGQSHSRSLTELHAFALRVREHVFTEKHASVIQSLIICGSIHRQRSVLDVAAKLFYRASHLGQLVLKEYSTVTVKCTTTFLTCTESIISTTRTEIITYREEMLKFVIKAFKHQHGETSEIVIRYYKSLAELYIAIHEEEKAVEIYRIVQVIVIKRYGEESEEGRAIRKSMTIVLSKQDKPKDVIEYAGDLFAVHDDSVEIWDFRRVKVTLQLAWTYEEHEDWFSAEETYILLWSRVLHFCHHKHRHDVDIHISIITIAIKFSEYLKRRGRHEEACSVLIVIHSEYEEETYNSLGFIRELILVGKLMRSLNLLSIALSVFTKAVNWFKATGSHKHEECHSCETLVEETVKEITTTITKTTTTSTTTISTEDEITIRQIFNSSMSSTTVTSETIRLWRTMISLYMKQGNWTQAIEVVTRSLTLIWKMNTTWGGLVSLPIDFADEAIEFAMLLANCHIHEYHYHEAEDIYVQIYQACRHSCRIDERRMTAAITVLIDFYEERKYYRQLIDIQKELLIEYRRQFGASHTITIKTLYILGRLCDAHGYGFAEEYYREINIVVNHGSLIVHREAWEATMFLFEFYYERRTWHELEHICKALWHTWIHHHHERKFEASIIELMYARYIYVLRNHSRCEYPEFLKVTYQYRDVCIKVFGESSTITIKAMVVLAGILVEREEHIEEAISLYEEVITKTSTRTSNSTTTSESSISESTITSVKEKLTKAYIQICSYGTVTSTTIDKAIVIVRGRFEYLSVKLGYSHAETLKVLFELVLLYWKLKTVSSRSEMRKLLQKTVIEIIIKETHSHILSETGTSIARIFRECELVEFGRELLSEIRRQVVIKTFTSTAKLGFKLEKVGRNSYVFIARFEATLLHTDFTIVMSDLLTESLLHEQYVRNLKSNTSHDTTIVRAAKLRFFWKKHHRVEECQTLEGTTFDEVFWKHWGQTTKTRSESARIFFIVLLDRLGLDADRRDMAIGTAACAAGNDKVLSLLHAGAHQSALEVATCVFHFAHAHAAYEKVQNVGLGFTLAAYMAGRGPAKPLTAHLARTEPPRVEMLKLSRTIMHDVLHTCRAANVSFVRLHLHEINDLVALLGEQGAYAELERVLAELWAGREARTHWPADRDAAVMQLGRRYVQACALAGQLDGAHLRAAIELCGLLTYNLQRMGHALAMGMGLLLGSLYTEAKRYKDAMRLHEDTIRAIVGGELHASAEAAREQVELLRRAFLRNKGWEKSVGTYKGLVAALVAMPQFRGELGGLSGPDRWGLKEQDDRVGRFEVPVDWELWDVERPVAKPQIYY